jgi:hypothetical protein
MMIIWVTQYNTAARHGGNSDKWLPLRRFNKKQDPDPYPHLSEKSDPLHSPINLFILEVSSVVG